MNCKLQKRTFFVLTAVMLVSITLYVRQGVDSNQVDSVYRDSDIIYCPSFEDMVAMKTQLDDPCLVELIRSERTIYPNNKPYNFSGSRADFVKTDQVTASNSLESFQREYYSPWVDALLAIELLVPKRGKRHFLECGALDGATFSQTIHLERYLNWTGVLIEADPRFYDLLQIRNRKAYAVQACASGEVFPTTAMFEPANLSPALYPWSPEVPEFNPGLGHVFTADQGTKWNVTKPIEVACIPIYTILLATNMTQLDLFVLDVEGLELKVLKTIPFDRVDIATFLLEFGPKPETERNEIKDFLKSKGYTFHSIFAGGAHPDDAFFVRNDLYAPERLSMLTVHTAYQIVLGQQVHENTHKFRSYLKD